jgi:TrmH family RNA methyltransferase
MGTILRLCDWFGVQQVVCSKETVDLYNPKVVQATMGSITRVNVSYLDLSDYIRSANMPVLVLLWMVTISIKAPCQNGIIVMGNEANGISAAIEKDINHRLSIPRFGIVQKTESLNVATATGIISEFKRGVS